MWRRKLPWYKYPALSFRGKSYVSPGEARRSDYDVVIVSGDAYVDHPAFAAAVVCRRLQQLGLSVAIIAQPDWNSDADFVAWGRPKLFFAVVPGAMDSMVANYTASRMPRGQDRLSPGSEPGLRPKRAVQIYVQKIRQLYKDVGVVIGGIEASLRRFVHYDFWEDRLRDPILIDAHADLLVYGMAEAVLPKVVAWFKQRSAGIPLPAAISQTCIRVKHDSWREWLKDGFDLLPSVEACRQDRAVFMQLSKLIDNSVRPGGKILIQQHPKGDILCFPPDRSDFIAEPQIMGTLHFNRRSHPLYPAPIAGLEPVQFSVQSHRGCLGTCTFCALSLHQGRMIRSRTQHSILAEIAKFSEHPDFKGIIPDIGGPSVNMYGWECRSDGCDRRMCIYPSNCPNLQCSLKPLRELLQAAAAVPGVKKVFLGSGIRYDLVRPDEWDHFKYIVFNHVSGQLKVAPEHFARPVLALMRKGENADFAGFAARFYQTCREADKKLFLVPYLMTAFPGSDSADQMLADKIKQLNLVHEQLQEFTPTPGSLATAMYYTGMDLSGKPIRVARSHSDRLKARNLIQGSDKRGGTGQRDDVQRRDKAPHKLDNRRSGPPTIRSAERPGNKKR
ncbi:MAG: YgiQ family radical SAM protein [Candidatus Riflebacteria bacterium HGW-Riflebacteria-1]|nr:MAG: YgiQ family radical SAM protein [Candidatus Riflebacteria bacterium HGW-Riflebacteria-1]